MYQTFTNNEIQGYCDVKERLYSLGADIFNTLMYDYLEYIVDDVKKESTPDYRDIHITPEKFIIFYKTPVRVRTWEIPLSYLYTGKYLDYIKEWVSERDNEKSNDEEYKLYLKLKEKYGNK